MKTEKRYMAVCTNGHCLGWGGLGRATGFKTRAEALAMTKRHAVSSTHLRATTEITEMRVTVPEPKKVTA